MRNSTRLSSPLLCKAQLLALLGRQRRRRRLHPFVLERKRALLFLLLALCSLLRAGERASHTSATREANQSTPAQARAPARQPLQTCRRDPCQSLHFCLRQQQPTRSRRLPRGPPRARLCRLPASRRGWRRAAAASSAPAGPSAQLRGRATRTWRPARACNAATREQGCGAGCSAAGHAPGRALRLVLLSLPAPVQHRVIVFVTVRRRRQPRAHDGKRLPVGHHLHGCGRVASAPRCGHGVAPRAATQNGPGAAALWLSVRYTPPHAARRTCRPSSRYAQAEYGARVQTW